MLLYILNIKKCKGKYVQVHIPCSEKLEIQTLVCYKVSFYLSSFELVALAVAEKNNVKVD